VYCECNGGEATCISWYRVPTASGWRWLEARRWAGGVNGRQWRQRGRVRRWGVEATDYRGVEGVNVVVGVAGVRVVDYATAMGMGRQRTSDGGGLRMKLGGRSQRRHARANAPDGWTGDGGRWRRWWCGVGVCVEIRMAVAEHLHSLSLPGSCRSRRLPGRQDVAPAAGANRNVGTTMGRRPSPQATPSRHVLTTTPPEHTTRHSTRAARAQPASSIRPRASPSPCCA
jgi:hypothetical protein